MELNFKNFPTLITERLILRNIENTDVISIHKLHSDAMMIKYIEEQTVPHLKLKSVSKNFETLYHDEDIFIS